MLQKKYEFKRRLKKISGPKMVKLNVLWLLPTGDCPPYSGSPQLLKMNVKQPEPSVKHLL